MFDACSELLLLILVALFRSPITTHLLCLCRQLTWPTSAPINCSIKAGSSSLSASFPCWTLVVVLVLVSLAAYICFFSHWFLKLLFFGLGFGIMGFNLPFCLFLVRSCSLFDLPQSQFCLSCVTAINNLSGQQSVSLSCNLKLRIASATLMKQENNLIKD